MTSLRALGCLVAVADHGSVTRAAAALHASQPAVSHQLAALEREAGTPLLHREARGVRLTPAGRAAVAEARRAIEAAASALRSARAVGAGSGGALRLVTAQSLISMLAPVLGAWHQERPEVSLSVRESTSAEEVLDLLRADEVDLVEPVMRTAVTTAAPQLAAAGLGVAVCPVTALTPGFRGAVRSFTPAWTRTLTALTPAAPDPLAARFLADLRRSGIPGDVQQLAAAPRPVQ